MKKDFNGNLVVIYTYQESCLYNLIMQKDVWHTKDQAEILNLEDPFCTIIDHVESFLKVLNSINGVEESEKIKEKKKYFKAYISKYLSQDDEEYIKAKKLLEI